MKKGWPTKPLGEVCERVTVGHVGITAPFYRDDGIMFLRTQNVGKLGLDLDDVKYITPEFHASLKKSEVKGGDILMSRVITHTVNCALVPADFGVANCANVVLVRPGEAVIPEFLTHYIRSPIAQKHLLDRKVGSAQLVVNTTVVKEWPVPLPPLAEQQRIVGLLDEAFEGLATAKANAEKNLQNARALFESHLQSVFTQRGPGWVEKRLEEVCGLQNGFAFKSSTFKPSGAPILRISNIQDGRIDAGNRLVFFDPKDYRENLDRYRIVEDDLLIAMSGATTGKLGFNTESTVYYLNQRVGKFEPSEKLNKRFLYHFLSTKVEENLRISAGAAQPNLSTEQIKGFVLPLPSVDEQERIVEALETLSAETQRLARLYERKHAALEALKKSLLHQAFAGDL